MRSHLRSRRHSKAGQAIVILALAGLLMIGGIGIAIDVAVGYLFSVAAERAAAAAALSGVVFMPDQFTPAQAVPAGTRNDASDRALDEAQRNGFDVSDTADGVSVTPRAVAGKPNELKVIVSRKVPVFFMEVFGFQPYTVIRSATAAYLPSISLGQAGNQLGSTVSQLGSGGSSFYFMRTEGWATDRQQGDAFTPNPAGGFGGSQPSTDVHAISAVNNSEPADPALSSRGGYNYRITIPNGSTGVVQVYNAVFGPDGNGSSANFCENDNQNAAARTCNGIRGNYWLHEDDGGPFNFGTSSNYAAMRYSFYRVTNQFIRGNDILLSRMTVLPIDARNWNQSSNQYRNINTGAAITQLYSGGLPTNMLIYHNWVDVSTYQGLQDSGLVTLTTTAAFAQYFMNGALVPGTYRLRVDTLDSTGAVPSGGNQAGAHKAYAVRVLTSDTAQAACTTCSVAAWNDMAFYTPVSIGNGGSFSIQLFELPASYAGLTIDVDIYDPGDISSTSGLVRMNILDPSGAVATSALGVNIYDLGVQRSNLAAGNYTVIASAQNGNTQASFVATDTGNGTTRNGHWVHIEFPVPSTYSAAPGSDWWSLQYVTGAGTTATDTVTVAVGLRGGPVHLVP